MIAIAGGKGGCGKTTTTLATARALVAAGIPVRAIDVDAGMPNLHRMADVDRDPSLADLLDGSDDAGAAAIQRDAYGVEIVPAPRALDDHDLPAALRAFRADRGITLLDCPAGAGPAATAPLREADATIVVTTDRPESVEDAAKTARMARSLGIPILGAIVTRTERVGRSVESALATDRVLAIPHGKAPLQDERIQDRYSNLVPRIRNWSENVGNGSQRAVDQTSTRRSESNRTPHSEESRPDGTVARQKTHGECPICGGSRRKRSRSTGATRPRDRRSPRSRVRGGTRSSSRGGGAPSDRR